MVHKFINTTINSYINPEGDFNNSEEEGSDFIGDDFETREPIFCFSGHFYEDRDFKEYKNKIKDY